ncbi:MAG: cysteine methyltransferase [Burkholderiales bacterium RIFCSPLOWO2_02_FULL_57_36]|nr:MAG: cysteine methyltransferase [Burkholderiales bacterium RIFCSPLOWO2_02_FULL_57_36]
MKFLIDRITSPIGDILLVSDDQYLRALDFQDYEARMHRLLRLHYGTYSLQPERNPAGLSTTIDRYMNGDLQAIAAMPVQTGGTAFQKEVWAALRGIPLGTTISYGTLALQINRPKAVRAVGLANGANPVGIVVPCHRVIGRDGALTGYGGGLDRKRWLLNHEGFEI